MNVLTCTGYLGADCRTARVNGTSVCNFNVAVKSGFGDKEQTLWIECALWGKRAESGLVQYMNKGQAVAFTGELSTREHEGKTYLMCRINEIDLIGSKRDNFQNQAITTASTSNYVEAEDTLKATSNTSIDNDNKTKISTTSMVGDYPIDDDIPF